MKKFTAKKQNKLSAALMDEYGRIPYGALCKIFKDKDVKVNGKRISEDVILNAGDIVECYYMGLDKKDELKVLYLDENVIIIDKPQSMDSDKMFERLKEEYPSAYYCHRLDTNTSGVMVFALNQRAYDEILRAFKERTFDKYYVAEVYGKFDKKQGVLSDFLIKDADKSIVKIVKNRIDGAKTVKTEYKVLKEKAESSIVEVKLLTGRTHQIRAHLAYYGHFIIGDGKYGDERINARFHKHKQCLQAYKIVFHFNQGDFLYYLDGKTVECEPLYK